jgi:ADP-ribose pyrophosphatase YjhB (NUDIX family)
MTAVNRVGARMILLDDEDRVLLIEETGEDPLGNWHHWLTPGGGVEAQESLTEAATREVVEETGVRVVLPPDAMPYHVQQRRWSWRGVTYDQTDHLFAARVSQAFDPMPAGLTEMELETVSGARWWSAAEIRDSDQTFLTPDIADLVGRIAADDGVVRPQFRPAGRVLVIDEAGRVLLIKLQSGPGPLETNWVAPGGGCDDGETPAQAAGRELAEETGIRADFAAVEPASVERAVFPFGGRLYDQVDYFFPLRVTEHPAIDETGLNDRERAMTVEYRWWSPDELRATSDRYWPFDLVDVIERLQRANGMG